MQPAVYPNATATVLDEKAGIQQFIATDETVDAEGEILRLSGWRFSRMGQNAPFMNSHNNNSIENQLGKVLEARVENGQLVETVQWAIDVPENELARLGWAMTKAGYLKGCSVRFLPLALVTRMGPDDWPGDWDLARVAYAGTREGKKVWAAQAQEMQKDLSQVRTVYLEQEQVELSACIIGSNPSAVAKSLKTFAQAHKAGVLSDADLDVISQEYAKRVTADSTTGPADVELARQRARTAFLVGLETNIKRL